jgi:hypothetical protein
VLPNSLLERRPCSACTGGGRVLSWKVRPDAPPGARYHPLHENCDDDYPIRGLEDGEPSVI